MTLAEYSRPSRVGYASQQGAGSAPVKVNRIVTVQGSNPEQSGIRQSAGCGQRTGQGKPHSYSPGFEPGAEWDTPVSRVRAAHRSR
jgi:hypothetical protein